MRMFFLQFLFLALSISCYGLVLSQNEAAILNQFFHTMLLQSEGGYVLHNAKPVCINGFYAVDTFFGESPRHQESVDLREGAWILKNLEVSNTDNNYIIHVYNEKDSLATDYIHLLFINKSLFIKTVQENLPLFQYVLGPTVTPHQLLNKLTDPSQTFHSVLKNDTVLIGILLGFGTQNSLYGSRHEFLQNSLLETESPPFKNKLLGCDSINEIWKKEILLRHRNSRSRSPNCLKEKISISSIQEEFVNGFKLMTISSPQLSEKQPNLIFGRLKNDLESEKLIPKMEIAQDNILKLLASKNFLQDVLKIIYPNEQVDILPTCTSSIDNFNFTLDEMKLLSELIGKGILIGNSEENSDFMRGIILGMKDADLNVPYRFSNDSNLDYNKFKILTKAKQNINQADLLFSKLANDQSSNCVLPLKLYYLILEKGDGSELKKQSEVTIHCKVEKPDSTVLLNTWENKQPISVNLADTISGFAFGMKNMRIGETRELYIHPSVGYGIYTTLEKGIYLKVLVQLIDILNENFAEFEIPSSFNCEEPLVELESIDFDEFSKVSGYLLGYEVWSHYKHANCPLDQVLEWMTIPVTEQNFKDYESEQNQILLNRLHWKIYHRQL